MTELSAPAIIAIGAAGAVIIGAIAAGVVSVITAWRTIAGKVSAIEGHVNSEKTASDGRENALRAENTLLREIIADKRASAGLLAQAAAMRTREDDPA